MIAKPKKAIAFKLRWHGLEFGGRDHCWSAEHGAVTGYGATAYKAFEALREGLIEDGNWPKGVPDTLVASPLAVRGRG